MRLLAAFITIFCLLLAQCAIASYVCPAEKSAPGISHAMGHAAHMDGCNGMTDSAQPGLCHAHCETAHQSFDAPTFPPVLPFIPGALSVILPDFTLPATMAAPQVPPLLLKRATAPPLAIRHCCLRI